MSDGTPNPTTNRLLGGYRRTYSGWTTDRRLNRLSEGAELALRRIHTEADDFGNFAGDLDLLRLKLFPRRPTITPEDFAARIAELEAANYVVFYDAEDDRYGHVIGWEEEQPAPRNGKRVRRIPAWPGESCAILGSPDSSSANQIHHHHHQDHSHHQAHDHHNNPPGSAGDAVSTPTALATDKTADPADLLRRLADIKFGTAKRREKLVANDPVFVAAALAKLDDMTTSGEVKKPAAMLARILDGSIPLELDDDLDAEDDGGGTMQSRKPTMAEADAVLSDFDDDNEPTPKPAPPVQDRKPLAVFKASKATATDDQQSPDIAPDTLKRMAAAAEAAATAEEMRAAEARLDAARRNHHRNTTADTTPDAAPLAAVLVAATPKDHQ